MAFYPRAEVVPGVWVGSVMDSRDPQFVKRMGLIVNCTKNLDFHNPHAKHVQIKVDDRYGENGRMLRAFPRAVRAIDEARAENKQVLIHCFAGMQRSCAVAAAYVMHLQRKNLQKPSAREAMDLVRARKPGAFKPVPTFEYALTAYEF